MSDLYSYCGLEGHGLYGGKDRDCPWCRIAELQAKLDRVRRLRNSSAQYQQRWSDNTVYLKILRDDFDAALGDGEE